MIIHKSSTKKQQSDQDNYGGNRAAHRSGEKPVQRTPPTYPENRLDNNHLDFRDPAYKRAGIFYADIANNTPLSEADKLDTHPRLVEAIKLMMENIANNDGRITHIDGYALQVEFKEADSALRCAINVQQAAQLWNTDIPVSQHLQFRIGVDFTDANSDHGDSFNNTSTPASRLKRLASSDGICVTNSPRKTLECHASVKLDSNAEKTGESGHVFWIKIDSQQIVEPDQTGAIKVSTTTS